MLVNEKTKNKKRPWKTCENRDDGIDAGYSTDDETKKKKKGAIVEHARKPEKKIYKHGWRTMTSFPTKNKKQK